MAMQGEVEDGETAIFYEVMIVGPDGRSLYEVKIDPETGAILEQEKAGADEAKELRGFRDALRHSELDLPALVRAAATVVKGVPVVAALEMEDGYPVCDVLFVNSRNLIEACVEARAGHLLELELEDQFKEDDDGRDA